MYSVLILPVIGGYFFASYSRYLRYRHQYLPPQRLLFHSIALGAGTVVLIALLLAGLQWRGVVDVAALPALGLTESVSMTVVCVVSALLLGIATALTLPATASRPGELHPKLALAIDRVGDEMDILLKNAAVSHRPLLITLDNGKVYVAYILSTPSPRETRYVSIRPVVSGFRDAEQRVRFTTTYPALEPGVEDPYEVVVELADITSFAKWDLSIYEQRFADQITEPPQQ